MRLTTTAAMPASTALAIGDDSMSTRRLLTDRALVLLPVARGIIHCDKACWKRIFVFAEATRVAVRHEAESAGSLIGER